ncbi:MAG: zf-HC2 domain-containing protein [Eubacteriales bacterium]|nr:zf-HC2 domain-containing protein [Eubacteriales bacterium]
MKNISCDVIQDLLPLYVDEMLSNDSIELVEEHLRDCPECSEQLQQLRQDASAPIQKQQISEKSSKNAFKKIKRKILMKRLVSVFVAIVLVLTAGRIGYYFYAEKSTYISLEDSGLKMDGDKLYATKPYLGRLHCLYSADQHVMFLIMTETMQAKHDYPEENVNRMLYDFGDQIDPADMDPEKLYEDRLSGIKKVYYLPEECKNFFFGLESTDVWEQQSREAVSKGILLWKEGADK